MRHITRALIIFGLSTLSCRLGSPPLTPSTVDVQPRIEPGMEYRHEWLGGPDRGPWSIYVATVDRSEPAFLLTTTLAQGHVYGLTPMSGQIECLGDRAHHPVAATNGDFFHIRPGPYQGDPVGLQIIDGELVSSPAGASFWVNKDGHLHMGDVRAAFKATGPDGLDLAFGLNEERPANKAVLYTPAIGSSTRTEEGVDLRLEAADEGQWLPLRAGERYQAKITAIDTEGDMALTPGRMVLSIGHELAASLPPVVEGQMITLDLKTLPDLKNATTALGGGPILLREGRSFGWTHRPERHPRTVIGWNDDRLFLVVVDGRQEGLSIGMNYTELSALMLRLGCTDAMNLDGGGSSTFWLGGHVMNSPSDGEERAVANGLVVLSNQQTPMPEICGEHDDIRR